MPDRSEMVKIRSLMIDTVLHVVFSISMIINVFFFSLNYFLSVLSITFNLLIIMEGIFYDHLNSLSI